MMRDDEAKLRDQIKAAWPADEAPHFNAVWQAAEERQQVMRRRYTWFAGAVAAIGAVVVVMHGQAPEPTQYIEVAELLETTYWSAPSDVLLPDREFDIYRDLPVIFESTELQEGALL